MTDQLLDPTARSAPLTQPDPRPLLRLAARCGVAGGVLGLVSLIGVMIGEIVVGSDFMESGAMVVLGAGSFLGSCLLVVAMLGVALRVGPLLRGGGLLALGGLALAAAATAGASATLLLVPGLSDRAPDLLTDPPAVVPGLFIVSGLLLGLTLIALTVALRRVADLPTWVTRLMLVAAVVTMVPLPSRYFLVAVALAAVCAAPVATTSVS